MEAAGGRIASRSDYTPVDYGQPSSYLEARIPYDVLDATVESIQELGDVQEVSLNSVDVSLQKIDLDARIDVLEAAIERLNELLAEAASTSDLIAVESALSERQAELDSLQSQRDYLSDQTLFATLSISLITPANATPAEPDGFLDGIVRGWKKHSRLLRRNNCVGRHPGAVARPRCRGCRRHRGRAPTPSQKLGWSPGIRKVG